MRILSGIQPSGALHIGNYFGAIRQYIALQEGNDAFYFVADYHALTSVRDAGAAPRVRLRRARRPALAGARPRDGHAVRPVGRARDDRAGLAADDRHADGLAGEVRQLQGQGPAGASRRARPVRLPGAPGGRHPALRRRPRARSARTRSSTWRSPATSPSGSTTSTAAATRSSGCPSRTSSTHVAVVPGLDGRKMSKSYNNTIEIFDDPTTIRKKCKKIVTDSTPGRGPQEPRHLLAVQPVQALRPGRRAGRGRAALPRGGDRLRRDEDPPGRGDHRARSPPPASGGPTGSPTPSAWPRSVPPPPPEPDTPPAWSSTAPARPAGSVDRARSRSSRHCRHVMQNMTRAASG